MNGWLDPASYGPHSRQYLGHTFRYLLARGLLLPGETVLDAACGVGYGSHILAKNAKWVYAIDGDPKALGVARKHYDTTNVCWQETDLDRANELPLVDVAVSFETIEHLDDPQGFAAMLRAAAARLIILSAPVIPTVGVNPHHKHDFSEESLRALVLNEDWVLYEEVRQGPYLILVGYQRQWTPTYTGRP